MVDTFEEKKELEQIKQKNKLEIMEAQVWQVELEHTLKIERLNKMLEIMVKQKHDFQLGDI